MEPAVPGGAARLLARQLLPGASVAALCAPTMCPPTCLPCPADKSLRETDKGFVMCRGASEVRREVPLLPVEEQSAEQQAEGIEAAAETEMEAVAAVARKFLEGEEEEEEEGSDEEDED